MLESLYRAGFKIADEQLGDDARRKIMRRVHEGAEVRLTGGYADGSGASTADPAGPVAAPAHKDRIIFHRYASSPRQSSYVKN